MNGPKTKVAIIGSGNIGTDLMLKILRLSDSLELVAVAGVDPESEGLQRAHRQGIAVTHEGIAGLQRMHQFAEAQILFDANYAKANIENDRAMREAGK